MSLFSLLIVSFFFSATSFADQKSYWLWPDMNVKERLTAQEIFILQGRMSKIGVSLILEPQGLRPKKFEAYPKVHLLFRFDKIIDSQIAYHFIQKKIKDWESIGQNVQGIQIDFDSPSLKLPQYTMFLLELRKSLPKDKMLTITGLGDWLGSSSPEDLRKLYTAVDEVFFQLYRKSMPIKGDVELIERLKNFNKPYRIGLLTTQNEKIYQELEKNPNFRGKVFFR